MFITAEAFYTGSIANIKDYQEALKRFKDLADKYDHSEAQYYLGRMYEKGQGVKQDNAIALDWYQKAAKNGHNVAKYKITEVVKKIAGN